MTLFTIYTDDTKLTEISGNVQNVKQWLNPTAPWAVSVMGHIAHDGKGNYFRIDSREI